MTERNEDSAQRGPDSYPQPDVFVMPSDSVLMAEANRDFYEGTFVTSMITLPDLTIKPITEAEKEMILNARIAQIRMALSLDQYDTQAIIDGADMETLSKDATVEIAQAGVVAGQKPIKPYQLENTTRTGANIVSDRIDLSTAKARKALIKRFKEAKKLAVERNVPEEDVFSDQQLYFELMRRSTSPEDVIAQTKEQVEGYKAVLLPLARHDYRSALLIASEDKESVTIDALDAQIDRAIDSPGARYGALEAISQVEEYMQLAVRIIIERYWGPKTAALFY